MKETKKGRQRKRKRARSPKDNFFDASVYYDVLCDYVLSLSYKELHLTRAGGN